MKMTLFYIPFPDEDSALKAISILLDEKMVACGNVIQSKSAYIWDSALCNESEYIAILKTLPKHIKLLEDRIKSIHPYDLPAILHWEVGTNEPYFNWIKDQLEQE
jgi:periplasmic divalent cation tolerance protein